MTEILTIKETAAILRVHKNTLIRWEKEGILIPTRYGMRGDRRYRKEDVEKLVKKAIAK